MLNRILSSVILSAPLAAACGVEPAPEVRQANLNLEVENGLSLNGTSFGGYTLQSASHTFFSPHYGVGTFPTWKPLQPLPTNGFPGTFDPFSGVGPNGSSFDGQGSSSVTIEAGVDASDLFGAELEGVTQDGTPALLHISGIAGGTGQNGDLVYYLVSVLDGQDWVPLCSDAQGQPVAALAVPGAWNLSAGRWSHNGSDISFACRGSSIAKCMEAGYKPWIDPRSGSDEYDDDDDDDNNGSLRRRSKSRAHIPNHLQACVRMLRADYCGDGTSHTVNGRLVEFWDSMGFQRRTKSRWQFEAAWDPDGAVCVTDSRVSFPGGVVPSCLQGRLRSAGRCMPEELDESYEEGKYLMNSFHEKLIR